MNQVTTIPNLFSILEETRKKAKEEIYEILWKIASQAEGLKEVKQKNDKLYDELRTLIPKDKLNLLIDYSDSWTEIAYLEEEAIIKYLINHGEELKNAIVSF